MAVTHIKAAKNFEKKDKLDKAKKLNIAIINEGELSKLL